MEPNNQEKPTRQEKFLAFVKRHQRLLLATVIVSFALSTAGSFFIEPSYAGNCTSATCINGYRWITISGIKVCVPC